MNDKQNKYTKNKQQKQTKQKVLLSMYSKLPIGIDWDAMGALNGDSIGKSIQIEKPVINY